MALSATRATLLLLFVCLSVTTAQLLLGQSVHAKNIIIGILAFCNINFYDVYNLSVRTETTYHSQYILLGESTQLIYNGSQIHCNYSMQFNNSTSLVSVDRDDSKNR